MSKKTKKPNKAMDWFKFSGAIIAFRMKNDMTTQSFADAAGMSRMAVYRAETGSVMDLASVVTICNVIGVTVQSFL